MAGYEHDLFSLSAFLFNGDAERVDGAGDPERDHIKDWGVSAKAMPADFVELGASFLSDLADTDAELVSTYGDRGAGWSAFIVVRAGSVDANAEVSSSVVPSTTGTSMPTGTAPATTPWPGTWSWPATFWRTWRSPAGWREAGS